MLSLPPEACGLGRQVEASLAATCVANPVTATLLFFRGYDTMLELAVLLLAVIAIRANRDTVSPLRRTASEIWTVMTGLLVPTMILTAGYLLWAGADAAGGAFQAGAVLAAAGVSLLLAGFEVPRHPYGLSARAGLALGLGIFVSLGIAGTVSGDVFLDDIAGAGDFVLVMLEAAAMVSVGLALMEMFGSILRSGGNRAGGES
jgi:multisubunit Na+/H+ antiporter MnhB subunit